MDIWIFMLGMGLLIPVSMILIGGYYRRNRPGTINAVIGYRTRRSMRNLKTWEFAHRYWGNLWWRTGWILLPATLLAMLSVRGMPEGTVGTAGSWLMGIQTLIMLLTIVPVERALKRTCGSDGEETE